jgi:hypothetical protein
MGSASSRSPSELDVLRRQARTTWDWFEATVGDVTGEQANWWPPGTANSIGATYLHVVINTDVEINRLIFSRPPLVEAARAGDVGQGVPYDPDRFDRWVRHAPVDWDRLREYGRRVHAAFVDSLEELGERHLEMPVDMTRVGLGVWEGRDLVELHGVDHPRIHGGEIACLKGLQGGVGWTESEAFAAAVEVEDLSAS